MGEREETRFSKFDGLFAEIRRSRSLERVPARRVLSGKKFAVFGAGALGGSIVVEPGPTVRWPLGDSAYGMNKGSALQEFVNKNYLDVKINSYPLKVGSVMNPDLLAGMQEGGYKPQGDILTYILERTDLVIDATAKIGVHHLLPDYCLRMGLNLLCSHSTLGAWGGMVVRFMPDQDKGCWVCLQRHINDDPKFINPP